MAKERTMSQREIDWANAYCTGHDDFHEGERKHAMEFAKDSYLHDAYNEGWNDAEKGIHRLAPT